MAEAHFFVIFLLGVLLWGSARGAPSLHISEEDLTILVDGKGAVDIYLSEHVPVGSIIELSVNHKDLISTDKDIVIGDDQKWTVNVTGLNAGHAILNITLVVRDSGYTTSQFVRVTIEHSDAIYHVSAVIGWIYFVAWSVSFYPQIYINWRRKSVVGLNFDFLSLNIVGFVLYSLFNCGLFWISSIEEEYFKLHPRGLNPVLVNDIVFSLHAAFATLLTIFQCFIYERGNQRVSWTVRGIHGIFTLFLTISIILAATAVITWLDFLYYCSYVKLTITLIKYVPQAYMNYRRRSTEGWSIGNIFLDFTGGIFSMLQMILNAYNYNDWESIFGDPTKFGLGLFSVVFDIFFILQHYVFYRHRELYIEINGENDPGPLEESASEPIIA